MLEPRLYLNARPRKYQHHKANPYRPGNVEIDKTRRFLGWENRLISKLCLLTGNADRAGDRLKRTFLALAPWWLLSQHGEGTA